MEKKNDYLGALVRYKVNLTYLENLHQVDPAWEHDLVMKAITGCRVRLARLEPLASGEVLERPKPDLSSGQNALALYRVPTSEQEAWSSMNGIEEYMTTLEIIHQSDPRWEAQVVEYRIKKCQSLMELLPELSRKLMERSTDVHTIQ